MAILHDPIANLDSSGRLVRLHCGSPGERCNLDDAENRKTVNWAQAFALLHEEDWLFGPVDSELIEMIGTCPFLCTYCFGGDAG